MGTDWVLVKGYHDSGTIDGVFGPYTEQYADWLLSDALDCSSCNWTKAKLKNGPEPIPETTASAPADASRQELSCTQATTERAWQPTRQAPVSAFGFTGQRNQNI